MSIEGSQWSSDRPESSDEDDSNKDKSSKDNKAPKTRWVRPPLPRSEGLFGVNQREVPIRPPIPIERIGEQLEDEDDDDESEKTEEHAATGAPAGASETSMADGSGQAEFMDIPLVDDVNRTNPAFAEMLEREMPEEFVHATSGPNLGADPSHFRAQEASSEQPASEDHKAQGTASSTGGGSSTWRSSEDHTTSTPRPAGGGSSLWRSSPASAPFESRSASSIEPARTRNISGAGVTAALEALKAVASATELVSNPYPLVTRVLTELAVKGFLTDRKQQRYEGLNQQLHQRDEQITQLQQEQRQTSERLATHLNQEVAPPAPEQQIFDQEGNEIVLQPGWRVDRSSGGYSVVLDQHNRVVHDAIRYGEAYQRDKKREQVIDDLFAAPGGIATLPSDDTAGSQSAGLPGFTHQPTQQNSFLVATSSEPVDLKHRLPKSHKQSAVSLASPWLWTAVAILIIVYFVAALA